MLRKSLLLMIVGGFVAGLATSASADNRVSASKKGSVIFYSKIELKWQCTTTGIPPVTTCPLVQDTFFTIVNDWPADVFVQWYFINGDGPLAPPVHGKPPDPGGTWSSRMEFERL
jgi:hypothetical protein